ncbi:hypothetical protein ETD83_18115 [Actinomadura soli]|uniref:DUF262 domain-containing protein n=1 Tax=Actinomadura soli TaxID=2508997 RepID=A0A5C4JAK9_9ACTN|nr:hypothetical protein [Actinomadura soli]TMQ99268.1 hypothetical protein ETD83_18115 [Actinomadura soli]
MFDQPYVKLADLLSMLAEGRLDVVQFGRPFQRNVLWAADLWASLARTPQYPISGFVWWVPPPREAPRAGRYRKSSQAKVFIVDGQQRCTALAGGAGIRPACYPPEVWRELGGPNLEVGPVLESTRRIYIQPMRRRKHPQVRLGDLLAAEPGEIPRLVAEAGAGARTHEASQLAAELTDIRKKLLDTTIPLAWLHAGVRDAAESYRVLNKASSTRTAHASEIETMYLDLACPGVRREVLDPLWRHARREGFGAAATLPVLNEVVQRLLPPAARRRSVFNGRPEQVDNAARRASRSCTAVIVALQRRGLVDPSLIAMPAAVGVLFHLAAHFEQAATDHLPYRWLVHALARGRYNGAAHLAGADTAALLRAADYAAARTTLVQLMLPAGPPPPVTCDQLIGRRGRFGAVASLYAMAAACPSGLGVPDLAEPDAVFPEQQMRLVPLWPGPLEVSLGNFVLATPATAEVLDQTGGWNREAYERLCCGDDALAAHCLPMPSAGQTPVAAPQLVKAREQDLLQVINGFLRRIGPLDTGLLHSAAGTG